MNNVLTRTKSDFSYKIKTRDGIPVISIIDLDLGGMTVTNDIENVVSVICEKEKLNEHECGIIYRDHFKCWDGWNPANKWFISLSTKEEKVAIKKIVKFKHDQK